MIKIKDAAEMLNLHIKTLQRLDRDGILVAKRTATNRRWYTMEQLEEFLNGHRDQERS